MSAENNKIASEMLAEFLKNNDMLVSTKNFLLKLQDVLKDTTEATETEVTTSDEKKVIISCDASIKVNPGGPASVGFVIEIPGKYGSPQQPPIKGARPTPATTNNQAEYDAVYTGLVTLVNLVNNPGCPIEIRSDSQLVIRHLNGLAKCKDKKLLKRRDAIIELAKELPVPVIFAWRPRNSTKELELANNLAQDLLGVPRH